MAPFCLIIMKNDCSLLQSTINCLSSFLIYQTLNKLPLIKPEITLTPTQLLDNMPYNNNYKNIVSFFLFMIKK